MADHGSPMPGPKLPRLPGSWLADQQCQGKLQDSPTTADHCCTAGENSIIRQRRPPPFSYLGAWGMCLRKQRDVFHFFTVNEDESLLQRHQQPPSTDAGDNHMEQQSLISPTEGDSLFPSAFSIGNTQIECYASNIFHHLSSFY